MIRKLGRIEAPPEKVRAMFRDVSRWSEWLPSIVSTRVVETTPESCLATVDQVLHGGVRRQTIELRFTSQGHVERQIEGRLKRYEADWRFTRDHEGHGTLISASIRLDLGFLGLFVSRRTVQRTIDRTFEDTLQGARKQIRALEAPASGPSEKVDLPTRARIRVYETMGGLEIWVGDRRYVAPLAD